MQGLVVIAAGFAALLAGWAVEVRWKRRLRRERRAGRREVIKWQESE